MPQLDTPLDPQAGDIVNRDKVTGGDIVHGDKAGSDIVRGNKYVTIEAGPRPTLYINVPLMPDHFLGREELVEALVDRLCAGQTTALWAGLGRTPDVASVQATWAEALGAEISDLLDPYARLQRINNSLGDRRLLLVLDDVWQWEAAAQLRCSGPQVVTMLTTRDQAIARRFAGPQQSVNVPVLATEPGYALLYALAPEACDTDPVAARRLAATVDGLPLALELLGGYLGASSQRRTQARRQQALTTVADPAARLALATQRLGDPQRQDVTLQDTMALSLADLPAATVAAFHALGAFAPKPARFDLPAALAVTQADEDTLFTLADRNLVEMADDETLALHQTLADLARRQMPAEAPLLHRDHYLAIVGEDRGDWQQIEAIYPQISYAWERQIATQPDNDMVVTLADRINTYQRRRGLRQDEIRWLKQGLAVVQANEDQREIARLLNNLGLVYDDLGEKARALAYYEQALPLHRQVGNKSGEATTLNNLGLVYDALGEKAQALAYYEQALPLRRQVGDKSGEATTLNNLGGVYNGLGEKARALAYYEQALLLSRQVGDKAGEASTLNNLGGVHDALGDKGQALAYYEQALPLRRQVGDKSGEASTLNNLGLVYRSLGDMPQALAYYEQALLLSRQVGDKSGEATTLNNLGAFYDALGDKGQALAYYEQALPISRQVGDKTNEARLLNNLGFVYNDLGEKGKALAYYEQALLLWRQVGDKAGEASTLTNLGGVYDMLGEKGQALAYYEQALPISRQVGDKTNEARLLNNLGGVYDDLGEKGQALAYYEQALPLRRQVGDKSGEASTLNNLGAIYFNQGELATAKPYFEQALALRLQVGDRFGEVGTRWWLGVFHAQTGNQEGALQALEVALALAVAIQSPDAPSIQRLIDQLQQAVD